MGFFDFIGPRFIETIQSDGIDNSIFSWRFPTQDMKIKNGAVLIVRQSQMVIFVDGGHIADVFGPGKYCLTAQTLPLLAHLKNRKTPLEPSFMADVYFFNTWHRSNSKWGTHNPIAVQDEEFGTVRCRAIGFYSYHIADPKKFHSRVSGTVEHYQSAMLEIRLCHIVTEQLALLFSERHKPFLKIAANRKALSHALKEKVIPHFEKIGLALTDLFIQNIFLPMKLQTAIDTRFDLGVPDNQNDID